MGVDDADADGVGDELGVLVGVGVVSGVQSFAQILMYCPCQLRPSG